MYTHVDYKVSVNRNVTQLTKLKTLLLTSTLQNDMIQMYYGNKTVCQIKIIIHNNVSHNSVTNSEI